MLGHESGRITTHYSRAELGKAITLEVPPEVAGAIKATNAENVNAVLKILAVPARTLRAGAVLAPDFLLRNLARDQISAYLQSRSGYVPVLDAVRGAFSLVKKDADFQNWLKSGGANAAMVALDRAYLHARRSAGGQSVRDSLPEQRRSVDSGLLRHVQRQEKDLRQLPSPREGWQRSGGHAIGGVGPQRVRAARWRA